MVHQAVQNVGRYHCLLPVAVPHPLVTLCLIFCLHPGLALLLSFIILLVGLLGPQLCLLPANTSYCLGSSHGRKNSAPRHGVREAHA